jgi:hypothetical protein
MNVRHVKYKEYSGFVIRGTQRWDFLNESNDKKSLHIRRALWLSAKIENNATFGTVQSYDGCGMSGGLEHQVAVYPKKLDSQGTIFKTISTFPQETTLLLRNALRDINWEIDRTSGRLLNSGTKKIITGTEIRDEFTPSDGTVPTSGPLHEHSKKWTTLFAQTFSDPRTFEAQIQAGLQRVGSFDALEKHVHATRLGANMRPPKELQYGVDLNADEDLALCVYHCFKVNAPAIAKACLKSTEPYNGPLWPRKLIESLANRQYGNWKARYASTRSVALNSGLWPVELFGQTGIMPSLNG